MKLEYDNLLGKPWKPGVADCFSLGRDFYKQNFDIDILNFARPTDWNSDNLDLINILFDKTGFIKHTDFRDLHPGDVLATAVGSTNPNHFVIFVGDNKIIHHKMLMLSSEETFRPAWQMVTCFIARHPDVPDLRPVYPDVSIEEILRARHQIKTD